MLENVGIVLNERESNKKKAANSLEAELRALDITSSRLKIDQHVEDLILQSLPDVLILDYLLGDFSTGLDILGRLQAVAVDHRPRVIFLTDEPSVSVAVEAMRLGALHYVELDNPRAIPTVVNTIRQLCAEPPRTAPRPKVSVPRLGDLVAHSSPMRAVIDQARVSVQQRLPLMVFRGNPGVGKRTLAEAMMREHADIGYVRKIDLEIDDTPLLELSKKQEFPSRTLQLGRDLSWIILNAEADDGSLLEFVADNASRFWPDRSSKDNSSFVYVCTAQEDIAKAWVRLAGAVELSVPPLDESRKEDIAPLVHQFAAETAAVSGEKMKPPPANIISWMTEISWSENVRQLRSVVINGLLLAKGSDRSLKEICEDLVQLWNSPSKPPESLIDSLTAAKILEASGGNYRIAAARIGCSPGVLRRSLSSEPHSEN